jgi:L-fuconolactonase
VLEVFGPDRVMWGSDWPVCQLEATYDEWREAAERLTEHLSDGAKEAVFRGTAARFYRL